MTKPTIDVGLFTNQRDAQLAFWRDTVGLTFDKMLKLGGGVQQHRFLAGNAVIKINHAREPLQAAPPSGYREVLIARPGITTAQPLRDPDANLVTLLPPDERAVTSIGIVLEVTSAEQHGRFLRGVLGAQETKPGVYRSGDSCFVIRNRGAPAAAAPLRAPGWRYLTMQVRDVDAEHARALAHGARQAEPPQTLGTTARISFILDPDGNWIEISQRGDLSDLGLGG